MYKQWVKSTLYLAAGAVRSFDHEWDVSNASPVLDKFGELVEDKIFSDEDAGELCKTIGDIPGVGVGLRKALMIAAWALENPWVDFNWPFEKYEPVYELLKKAWEDRKFTTKELAAWLEKIADTIVLL
ncbi:unnamed protein product [marine sediment metagenome]|uniref:Uncharacterized protein n=1 Tax=marine sediment metagenome TaxID=412755 RepID=X1MHF1_9ZZZZ